MTRSVTFDRWDVIVSPYPFVEIFESKIRPVLVLTTKKFNENHGICFAAMITTARKFTDVRTDDIPIKDVDMAGLKRPCVVRMSRLSTIELTAECRKIGTLAAAERPKIDAVMRAAFDW
jgi:mRNA interferase MazF